VSACSAQPSATEAHIARSRALISAGPGWVDPGWVELIVCRVLDSLLEKSIEVRMKVLKSVLPVA